MRKVTAFLLLLLVTLLLLFLLVPACSCSGEEEGQPPLTSGSVVVTSGQAVPSSVQPDVCGKITSISFSSDTAVMLVEGENDENAETVDTAWITIDKKTAIAREGSEGTVDHFSLSAGDTVEVWFVNSVAETSPVQAYAQAVKILKADTSADENGIINLPKMTVNCGASSSLSTVTDVTWNKKYYDYGDAEAVLSKCMGSNLSVRSGENISLSFHMPPDSFSVTCDRADGVGSPSDIDTQDGTISIPKDAAGKYIYTVNVMYGENNVVYVFSVFAFA